MRLSCHLTFALLLFVVDASAVRSGDLFVDSVAPILSRRCLSCHNDTKTGGGLSMVNPQRLIDDGYVDQSDAAASHLMALIAPDEGVATMPKDSDPLRPAQITSIKSWIDSGAKIPDAFRIEPPRIADLQWWSLQPISSRADQDRHATIDDLIESRLVDKGLVPLPPADAVTLIRRVTYDLHGLPPTPDQIDAFVSADKLDPDAAWEGLVNRLLASPEFGEKWGQHWLDIARYAETHGYDKDQPRHHAWPYRDYVINALNSDKPFGDFVREQIAGDVLADDRSEGIVATGFLAAGPWDLIAHKEVGEAKLDGRIAKHLDRDEMATAVFNVFQSTTIQCAQCHNHKFDPIESEDYYRVHAVFAGIDRADRVYAGLSPDQQSEQRSLIDQRAAIIGQRDQAQKEFQQRVSQQTKEIDPRIEALSKQANQFPPPAEHGFHSTIAGRPDQAKWVEIDLGTATRVQRIELVACYDDFNQIGSGFGFPVRFKVQVTAEETFDEDVARTLFDSTETDFVNPQSSPVKINADGLPIRIIRVTATKLAERRNDFILALGELLALDADGEVNLARGKRVTASDQIPPNLRWAPKFLVDGKYHRSSINDAEQKELNRLRSERQVIVESITTPEYTESIQQWNQQISEFDQQLKSFPIGELVYAAASEFQSSGNFRPTQGKVREIHFLNRGDLTAPGKRVLPGAPRLWPDAPSNFIEQTEYDESEARAALATYVTRRDNPLLWRSMANRIWQWTFGKPLVGTPNDFGRMGAKPNHPLILDSLAAQLRDDPSQSIKSIVRQLVLSDAYRRSSLSVEVAQTVAANRAVDANNDFLWRANRRRLTAEEFRDSALAVSGVLRQDGRGGPSFRDFVVLRPEHSPHYEYELHDPNDPASHRRTVYRFVVRSQPQPMLTTLDCADPSISVARRDESTTSLQALTQWNNRLVEAMSKRFAERLRQDVQRDGDRDGDAVGRACRLAWGRVPSDAERETLVDLHEAQGTETLCRVILNASAMMYID